MQSDSMSQSPRNPARDAHWLAHRYDENADQFRFVHLTRAEHAAIPFLTDEHLGERAFVALDRQQAVRDAMPAGPVHFIFHSAFCCSTLLARALDAPGVAMALSEPVLLNDIVGWRHRHRPDGRQVAALLDQSLSLLARPWGKAEAVVLKPSNLLNPLAPAMMALRPDARAVLLRAPLSVFLGSIARKGLWGRLWVRELLVKYLREAGVIEFGLGPEDLLQLSDLQVAALCWLAQLRIFTQLEHRMPERVLSLHSDTLMADPRPVLGRINTLMQLGISAGKLGEIVSGPAFTRHSKSGESFDAAARAAEREDGLARHADEITMVIGWAEKLAASIGLRLPAA